MFPSVGRRLFRARRRRIAAIRHDARVSADQTFELRRRLPSASISACVSIRAGQNLRYLNDGRKRSVVGLWSTGGHRTRSRARPWPRGSSRLRLHRDIEDQSPAPRATLESSHEESFIRLEDFDSLRGGNPYRVIAGGRMVASMRMSAGASRMAAVLVLAVGFWPHVGVAGGGGRSGGGREIVGMRVNVRAGESTNLKVIQFAFLGLCRDRSIARMEYLGDSLAFSGITTGVTRCYFWGGERGQETIVEVTVAAPGR